MEYLDNPEFVDRMGSYINAREFKKGFVVARTFSPRGHSENGKKISGWLPDILICEGSKDTPIIVQGGGIIARGPAKSYSIQLNPWFDEETRDKLIYTFKKSFILENESLKEINAIFHDTKGYYDNLLRPGEISYSSISNRDIVLQGPRRELEEMVLFTLMNFPRRGYDLEYGENTANGKSKYKIEIPEEDKTFFVEEIIKNLK